MYLPADARDEAKGDDAREPSASVSNVVSAEGNVEGRGVFEGVRSMENHGAKRDSRGVARGVSSENPR